MSIIKVENLSKKYVIGHDLNEGGAYRYKSLRDSLSHTAKSFYQRLRHPLSPNSENTEQEDFWALKDINFEIQPGDRVGIIGRNGAGKSTLLKVLSRITEPTTGKITINGRVASLLEVGTGFHPELTGRENIYLNGAILGMTRKEIKKVFDEIVDFAEIEKFLDTPVKRYSSGMYVRLAFAVAAHLEPDILIVDEVLAVGDAAFQKKCLGKMEDVSTQGRTVIFVSHNMGAINQLCNHGIILQDGIIICHSDIEKAIQSYISNTTNLSSEDDINSQIKYLHKDESFTLQSVFITQSNIKTTEVTNDKPLEINIRYTLSEDVKGFHVYFQLCDLTGIILFESLHDGDSGEVRTQKKGSYISSAIIPKDFLNEAFYEIRIYAGIHNIRMCIKKPILIQISVTAIGTVNSSYPDYTSPGKILPKINWITK